MAARRRGRRSTSKKLSPEDLLVIRVTNYLKMNYPDLPFRVDLVDRIGLAQGKEISSLHGKWSKGYPDLKVCWCTKKYGGLYVELKATKTVPNTQHTRTQANYHAVLRRCGYKVSFACGFEEATTLIDKYLKKYVTIHT